MTPVFCISTYLGRWDPAVSVQFASAKGQAQISLSLTVRWSQDIRYVSTDPDTERAQYGLIYEHTLR